jgi:BlaI family penicillinase repressor
MAKTQKHRLSPLEDRVMKIIWDRGSATAEDVRQTLSTKSAPVKDSTVRTILRRLEAKGFTEHRVEGRTFIYSPTVESQSVATDAVRGIIERFCDGSVEDLLVGMVNDNVVTADKLKELAQRIAKAEQQRKRRAEEK